MVRVIPLVLILFGLALLVMGWYNHVLANRLDAANAKQSRYTTALGERWKIQVRDWNEQQWPETERPAWRDMTDADGLKRPNCFITKAEAVDESLNATHYSGFGRAIQIVPFE